MSLTYTVPVVMKLPFFFPRYTYGQGVPGKVSGRVCRAPVNYYSGNACNRNPDGLCLPITGVVSLTYSYSGLMVMHSPTFVEQKDTRQTFGEHVYFSLKINHTNH